MEQYLLFDSPGYPVLSLLVLLPLGGAVVCLFVRRERFLKAWGLLVTTATALLALPMYGQFDRETHLYQFAELRQWIPALQLDYAVGVDGISLLMVLLTVILMPLCVLCSWNAVTERLAEFVFVLLLMESAMIGVFVSLNTVLFYVFWEGMLVPMYLLIAVWGGPRKDYASIKFFLYTLAGSVFLLVAMIVLYVQGGTFFLPALMDQPFSLRAQLWIFAGCSVAFAIKIPMYPFHTWLPATHVEAPTAGSVILASVLLKMGGYGFVRFCLPIAPQATLLCAPLIVALSLAAIIIGGFLALAQSDVKRLIAYSSVAHMGFVTLGIFMLSPAGIKGAVLEMVNHGIIAGALFICIGIMYERTGSRELAINRALGRPMPRLCTFLTLFALAALGFPGTSGFIGEFLIMLAAFERSLPVGALVVPGAVLAAAYMLRMLQKILWAGSDGRRDACVPGRPGLLQDLSLREFATLMFLAGLVVWIGLNPTPLLDILECSVAHVLEQAGAAGPPGLP
jgi:NADH-quinone oxidoreductase subunit M